MKTGTELIAEERREQVEKHGWTADHDDQHGDGILADAALFTISPTFNEWPFEDDDFKDKIKNKKYKDRLIIAGAFIAAEIDRIQRDESIQT